MTRIGTATEPPGAFSYEIGEEVVSRLDAVDAVLLDAAGLPPAPLPPWTVGIVAAGRTNPGRSYLLVFRHDECRWICWVSEGAIEGIV